MTLSKVVVGGLQRLGMKRARLESPGNLQSFVGHEGGHGASSRRGVGDAKPKWRGRFLMKETTCLEAPRPSIYKMVGYQIG